MLTDTKNLPRKNTGKSWRRSHPPPFLLSKNIDKNILFWHIILPRQEMGDKGVSVHWCIKMHQIIGPSWTAQSISAQDFPSPHWGMNLKP